MAGRKNKEFDKESFQSLLELQCTQSEVCRFFNTTDKTLSKWCKRTYGMDFSECLKKFGANGRISLRRKQWKLADRSATMAIWLGKQYLGQKDVVEVESKGVHPMIAALSKAMEENK